MSPLRILDRARLPSHSGRRRAAGSVNAPVRRQGGFSILTYRHCTSQPDESSAHHHRIYPPPRRNAGPLVLAAAGAVALSILGGFDSVDAHYQDSMFDTDIMLQDYEIIRYDDYNLMKLNITITNHDLSYTIPDPIFYIGGHDDGGVFTEYESVKYDNVLRRGGDVSPGDCAAADRWKRIGANSVGETTVCFMYGHDFNSDGLGMRNSYTPGTDPFHISSSSGLCDTSSGWHDSHRCANKLQIIPFNEESSYCSIADNKCDLGNVWYITTDPIRKPSPEQKPAQPEPEPHAGATLLHAMYNNHTGTLTMVFDSMVVASNPDRILLIHDIDAYIDDGAAPNLGAADIHTVDNKRQSAVLAFALDDTLRLAITESLRTHGDLVLYIDTRAIYAADGFVDITDGSPVLVSDVMVVR